MSSALFPLALLIALGAGALAFDLTLPSRLPAREDWAEAAGALRARGQPGDAVQVWPPWAERARLVVDALPVFTDEDLRRADYIGVSRLWLLALPEVPRARMEQARQALRSRGAAPLADELRFGALSMQAWDLHAKPLATELTALPKPEFHEVEYVARRCVSLPIGGRFEPPGPLAAGTVLHLRAGVEGEKAYQLTQPPIALTASADGVQLASLTVKSVEEPGPAWQGIDLPLPPGAESRRFAFAATSAGGRDRRLCFSAWTTR